MPAPCSIKWNPNINPGWSNLVFKQSHSTCPVLPKSSHSLVLRGEHDMRKRSKDDHSMIDFKEFIPYTCFSRCIYTQEGDNASYCFSSPPSSSSSCLSDPGPPVPMHQPLKTVNRFAKKNMKKQRSWLWRKHFWKLKSSVHNEFLEWVEGLRAARLNRCSFLWSTFST